MHNQPKIRLSVDLVGFRPLAPSLQISPQARAFVVANFPPESWQYHMGPTASLVDAYTVTLHFTAHQTAVRGINPPLIGKGVYGGRKNRR